jgi:putative addiction module component (TIGR02574 family)
MELKATSLEVPIVRYRSSKCRSFSVRMPCYFPVNWEKRMSDLPQNLQDLSAAEKLDLLDALWESLESDFPALTAEQRAELDCREARFRENPAGVVPWEQVKADLLKKR